VSNECERREREEVREMKSFLVGVEMSVAFLAWLVGFVFLMGKAVTFLMKVSSFHAEDGFWWVGAWMLYIILSCGLWAWLRSKAL
jgi:hypothetical protein